MKKLLLSILLLGFLALTARAQSVVLLFVDDSNPADVVITSTGNDPLVSNSTFTTYDGVSLLQFFTSNLTETDNGTVSGDLTPQGAIEPFDTWSTDNSSGSSLVDFSPYYSNQTDASTEAFDTSSPAFTGQIFVDLSNYTADLPGPGVTGNIVAGYTFNGEGPGISPVLGQWQVVPEPAASALLGGLLALAAVVRTRALSLNSWRAPARKLLLLLLGLIGFATTPSLRAVTLLIVDDSNPSAITITSTGANPLVADGNYETFDGVDLVSFFSSGLFTGNSISGNLTAAGVTQPYNVWTVDDTTGPYTDFNLYVTAGNETQTFDTSVPAFTGTATVDLSAFTIDLPADGATGNLVSGYVGPGLYGYIGPGVSPALGQWVVVAEPALSALLGGLGVLVGVVVGRRWRLACLSSW
jgi:hypothetical protein